MSLSKRHTPESEPRLTPMANQLKVEKLRALRKERGWSRTEMARLAGTSSHTYSRWENGSVVPFEEEYEKLIAALGCEYQELLSDEANPKFWG